MALDDEQGVAKGGVSKPPERYYSRKRIRRSLMHYLVGRGVSSIANFLVVFLVIRALSVESYAAYTTLSGLLIMTMAFSNGGLERVVPRYLPVLREDGAEAELKRLTWQLLFLRIAFLAVILLPIVVFEDFLRAQFSIPEDRWAIWGFYAYVVVYALSVHLTRSLQALLLQRESTIALSIEWFSKLALLVAFLFLSGGISLAQTMWAHAITSFLGALYMVFKLRANLVSRPETTSSEGDTVARADLISTGWHNYCQRLLGTANSPGANRLICSYMLDSAATAGFGFALAINGLIRRFAPATLLLGLIEPSVMARYSEEKDFTVLQRSASIVVKFSLFVLAPATAWVLFAGQPVAAFVSGGKYTHMTWLVAGMMVMLMIGSNRTVLTLVANAVNESSSLVRATAWSNVLFPVLIFLVWQFGLPGLLGGILLIAGFDNLYLVHRLRSLGYGYRIDAGAITKIILFAALAAASGSLIPHFLGPALLTSLLAAAATGIIFLTAAYIWKPFTGEERKLLNGYIGKKVFVW